jgi:hypothetical protein
MHKSATIESFPFIHLIVVNLSQSVEAMATEY